MPYDLRHTFASILLSDGVPLLYVSKQLGHSKPDTTLKYYARWIPDAGANFVNQLDLGTKSWHQPQNEAQTTNAAPAQAPDSIKGDEWSRRSGLNRRPADYEQTPDQTSPIDPDVSATKPTDPT